MSASLRALETTGTIDEQHRLVLDDAIPVAAQKKVRVLILLPEESDIDEKEWLKAASANPAFEFLNDPAEDLYTATDGEPFRNET